eukprot:765783-Hanusia_phi.AAC.1
MHWGGDNRTQSSGTVSTPHDHHDTRPRSVSPGARCRSRLISCPQISPSLNFQNGNEEMCSQATSQLLDSMSARCRDECISRMKVKSFQKGEVIIEQGTIGTSMVCLQLVCN